MIHVSESGMALACVQPRSMLRANRDAEKQSLFEFTLVTDQMDLILLE
jgi:hypothetical protein